MANANNGNTEYMNNYYTDGYADDNGEGIIPAPTPGSGVSEEEVKAFISSAMSEISLSKTDNDTYSLMVGERNAGNIDDIYVTGATQVVENGKKYINFERSNDKDPVSVELDTLEDEEINGGYFNS